MASFVFYFLFFWILFCCYCLETFQQRRSWWQQMFSRGESLAAGRQLSFNFEIVVKTVCLQPQTWRNWDNYICIYFFHVRNNLFSRFYPEWLLNINIITLKAVVHDFRYQTKKRNAQYCGNYFAIFLELKWEKCVQLTYYSQCDDITRLCPGGVSCT